jgi:Mn-dependent DtxR family transcriptional regulator
VTAHGLIDTTEMYLRTVFELEEEGIVPLRARIAERLSQSGPTVSQTVARMARDKLLTVEGDRQLALTDTGRTLATRVMRKHRLAECLLVNVIGLPWEEVHIEACRWEHVISDTQWPARTAISFRAWPSWACRRTPATARRWPATRPGWPSRSWPCGTASTSWSAVLANKSRVTRL